MLPDISFCLQTTSLSFTFSLHYLLSLTTKPRPCKFLLLLTQPCPFRSYLIGEYQLGNLKYPHMLTTTTFIAKCFYLLNFFFVLLSVLYSRLFASSSLSLCVSSSSSSLIWISSICSVSSSPMISVSTLYSSVNVPLMI